MTSAPLPLITALARSGALDRAWLLFTDGGHAADVTNPAALAVKGRLLKDRALRAQGAERRALFRQAADAYQAADRISPAPYLLINVATLAFLGGDIVHARAIAKTVLTRLDDDAPLAETPYWLEATRAEALLLSGKTAEANTALSRAIAHDPDGWKDHASTLRQFGMILKEAGQPTLWLDPHRPPVSLHFAGHLGIAPDDEGWLRAAVDEWLEKAHVGFGFGALAVGADIIIAEALLARDAELHVVLPVGRAAYFAQSIDLVGGAWRDRFTACLEHATSISEVTQFSGGFEPLTVALAGDRSMGAAVLNARMLEGRAAQLIIADDGDGPYGSGRYTARDAIRWKARGHDQHVIICPRSSIVGASGRRGPEQPVPSRRLATILHLTLTGTEQLSDADWPLVEEKLFGPLRATMAALPDVPFLSRGFGKARVLAFDDVLPACMAAQAAMACIAALDVKALGLPPHLALTIGGHYGIVHASAEGDDLYGAAVDQPARAAVLAHPGSFTVTENFANALAFQTGAGTIAEYVGDMDGAQDFGSHRLFAIKTAPH